MAFLLNSISKDADIQLLVCLPSPISLSQGYYCLVAQFLFYLMVVMTTVLRSWEES